MDSNRRLTASLAEKGMTSTIPKYPIRLLEVRTGSVTLPANGDKEAVITYSKAHTVAYPVLMQVATGNYWYYVTTAINYSSNTGCRANFHNLQNVQVTVPYQLLVFGY